MKTSDILTPTSFAFRFVLAATLAAIFTGVQAVAQSPLHGGSVAACEIAASDCATP